MNDLGNFLPPDLEGWIEARIADGRYVDAGDYLRDLIRRDRARLEDTEWVCMMVEEGLAADVIEAEPDELIKEIIGELDAEDG